ncbi:MAG: Rrf2 family transcriptional regulator [Planctomycetota bacterium]|nr:Rrf2 family transcriptional regulator [Planctomycetota bacterium]
MFRISKKGDYAIFILGFLSRQGAVAGSACVVSAQEVADHSNINRSVIANLLKLLTQAGLLESTRGIRGGYRLAVPAKEMSLREILEPIMGSFVLVDCATNLAGTPLTDDPEDLSHSCNINSLCASKHAMRLLHQRIARVLENTTLGELIEIKEEPLRSCATPPSPLPAIGGQR